MHNTVIQLHKSYYARVSPPQVLFCGWNSLDLKLTCTKNVILVGIQILGL